MQIELAKNIITPLDFGKTGIRVWPSTDGRIWKGRHMGGRGSGRRRKSVRLDDLCSIDVNRLRRERLLERGRHGALHLLRAGREAGSINLRCTGDTVVLSYCLTLDDGDAEEVEQPIGLVRILQPFGGTRAWLVCPGCGCRCGLLYRTPRFQCRTCVGGSYASQSEEPRDRHLRRLQTIRAQLGDRGSLLEPFPKKPKRMRWATYLRLLDEAKTCFLAARSETWRQLDGMMDRFEKLAERSGIEVGAGPRWLLPPARRSESNPEQTPAGPNAEEHQLDAFMPWWHVPDCHPLA